MSQDTVYISAAETGLVKWDEFRKPPYSAQDYLDAYNNGQRMVQAFMTANANGASKVVLERGNYPLCYVNDLKSIAKLTHNNLITGTTNLTIDGNGSCTFTIFDSVNRSPYHTGEGAATLKPYQLSGAQFWLEHNTNLTIKGFNLRGDQYMRSWITGEKEIEQTYGIVVGINNINTKIDIVGHGFRGDAITSKDNRLGVYSLTNGYDGGDWLKGGLSTTNGDEIIETGAYRTRVMDMREKTIYRNAVQLMTLGNAGAMQNREDAMRAFFYDENNVLISTELVWQAEFIYLPVNCVFMRIVAYGDERTEDTVGYGVYIFLYTGCSNHALVKGEYFANMRGAVSNLCNNTIVDADIHDNGTTKYGFPIYSDTTRYGVNFEDSYYSKLTVKGSIRNGGSAILCNARRLDVDCDIKNMQYTALGLFGTKEVNALGGVITNSSSVMSLLPEIGYTLKRFVKLKNLTVRNSALYGDYSNSEGLTLDVSDNTFDGCTVSLKGNDNNLIFNNNTVKAIKTLVGSKPYTIERALSSVGNTVDISQDSKYGVNNTISLDAKKSNSNLIVNKNTTEITLGEVQTGRTLKLNGFEYEGLSGTPSVPYLVKSAGFPGEVFQANITDCKFTNGYLRLGTVLQRDYCDSVFTFDNTVFAQQDATKTHFLEVALRESLTTGVHKIIFKNCEFNLPSTTTSVLRIAYAIVGKLDILFIDCTFIKDTPTTERLKVIYSGNRANITARGQGCRFINVGA